MVLVSGLLSTPSLHRQTTTKPKPMSTHNTSIESCIACMIACEQCLTDCMETQREDCAEMCRDCADICALTARMQARNSMFRADFVLYVQRFAGYAPMLVKSMLGVTKVPENVLRRVADARLLVTSLPKRLYE